MIAEALILVLALVIAISAASPRTCLLPAARMAALVTRTCSAECR